MLYLINFYPKLLKVEIKKAEPRDANKAQEEGGQWGTHPDNQWGMPVGPPGMPGLNNVCTVFLGRFCS